MFQYAFGRKRERTESSDESDNQKRTKDFETFGLKLLHPGAEPVIE